MTSDKGSDALLMRQLHQEYQDILLLGKNMVGEIYLVDILAKLHFIDTDFTQDKARQFYAFIEKSKQNILVKSELEQFKGEQEDIPKNLFKITCAILNLQVNQRGTTTNYLDEDLLKTYLESINHSRDEHDLILINQLATIKNLINRPTYSLSDRQIRLIHLKFKNMADSREAHFTKKTKDNIIQKETAIEEQYNREQMGGREIYTPQAESSKYNNP